jgi:predicted protein tyrosine phosphatase
MSKDFKREKNWKQLYIRSTKLARAKQLGFEYPVVTEAQLMHGLQQKAPTSIRTNVLFVCSRNQWRSPTAEQVWRKHPALFVRSGGTNPNARHPVSAEDLSWAQVIFVMEEKHKSRLVAEYRRLLENKPIHVLDIPDEYRYMDAELVDLLKASVGAILGLV